MWENGGIGRLSNSSQVTQLKVADESALGQVNKPRLGQGSPCKNQQKELLIQE